MDGIIFNSLQKALQKYFTQYYRRLDITNFQSSQIKPTTQDAISGFIIQKLIH